MTLREWYDNMGPDIVFEELEALYAPVRGSYKTLFIETDDYSLYVTFEFEDGQHISESYDLDEEIEELFPVEEFLFGMEDLFRNLIERQVDDSREFWSVMTGCQKEFITKIRDL